jgi:hypothetical protein
MTPFTLTVIETFVAAHHFFVFLPSLVCTTFYIVTPFNYDVGANH